MKKSELKAAKDNQIIEDYVHSQIHLTLNLNHGGPTKALTKHLKDLDAEMLKRGLLTQEQIDRLNS